MVRAPDIDMAQHGGSSSTGADRSQRASPSGCVHHQLPQRAGAKQSATTTTTTTTTTTSTSSYGALHVGGVTLNLGHHHIHHWTYPTSGVPAALPGAATFHFGPGFEPHPFEEAGGPLSSSSSSSLRASQPPVRAGQLRGLSAHGSPGLVRQAYSRRLFREE
ncbi:uncharacterized protein LOC126456174 [Schistocerca serialis cubense]|uniref:uncharacterized protein LOC126456174 n=1 Tax=Schistocerca serialis cubense TaxID=2023355 RepID=UPI00214E88CB|nr:uncharacterized protein LOC126456174 [Schistocerca serialis cubense]